MKISNAKIVKAATYVLLFAAGFPIMGIVLSHQIFLDLFFCGIIALILFILIRIRSTEVEDSGGCFTVRRIHPLAPKGYVRPKVEFPISLIRQFMVKEGWIADHLNLKIQSQSSRKSINVDLVLFDRKQIRTLQSAMQNQISY